MEILEAWCVELGEVVDIYDAQNAYFDLPEKNRKRFTFGCSDEQCRRTKNPLVSGVNYHNLAEETDKFLQPHFRRPAANEHLTSCIWYESAGEKAVPGSLDGDGKSRVARAKKTDVLDIFQPAKSYAVMRAGGQSKPADAAAPAGVAHANETNDSTTRKTGGGYSKTSRLERFIDCWLQFEGDDLKVHEVAAIVESDFLAYFNIFRGKFVPVPYHMPPITCILDDFRSRHSNDTAGALIDAGHGVPLLRERPDLFLR